MNSKRKGDSGELELLHYLEEHGIPCHRNQQGILAAFAGGANNPDIWAMVGKHELHIECKRTERFSLYAAMEQAEADCRKPMRPVVVHRANRKPWVVVLTLEDFLSMLA